jgi:hypothetical protein
MTGLSYGGFYTLMTSALEPRIRAGYALLRFLMTGYVINWPDFTLVWICLLLFWMRKLLPGCPHGLFILKSDDKILF